MSRLPHPRRGADELDDLASPGIVAWALGGAAVGTALALVVLPAVADAVAASMSAPQPKTWWYLSRASGLVSYALLSASMVLGLLLSSRLAKAWPGAAQAFTLHEHASALGLAFALFHAIVLLGDRYASFTLAQIVLPFGAAYRPIAVGAGQLALYGTALLVGSFYVRRRIGQRAWRWIHFASFVTFALALWHGLGAGTDRALMIAAAATAAIVLFLTIDRVLVRLLGSADAGARTS